MIRKLLLLAALLLSAGPLYAQTVQCLTTTGAWGPCPFVAPPKIVQVNNKVSAGAGTTITNAFGSNTGAGNAIACMGFESPAAVPVFTDAQANGYVVASSSATAPGYTVAFANNIVGGTTDTITLTTTSGAASFSCYEIQGAVTIGQLWDFADAKQATSATLVFDSETDNIPNDLVFAGVGMNGGTINATPTLAGNVSGLTTVDQSNVAVTGGAALAIFYSAHSQTNKAPTFRQILSLSASETYSAVLFTVRPVVLHEMLGLDPCQYNPKTPFPINMATGTATTIMTGVAAKQWYVCSINIISAAAMNIALIEGTTGTCGTGTAGMAGGTTAATGWNLAANSGLTEGDGLGTIAQTVTAGDSVCLLNSGSTQLSGTIMAVNQ
jgi:hypothetical protein